MSPLGMHFDMDDFYEDFENFTQLEKSLAIFTGLNLNA